MILKMLIKDMETENITGSADTEITGIAYDSRKVKPGDVFVAIKGEHVDGHRFIEDAVKRGARAVVYDSPIHSPRRVAPALRRVRQGEQGDRFTDSPAVFIFVNDSRDALAYLSNNFYERPSDKLTVIGITGTNGKTTATYLIKSILEAWGKAVGLIGTINYLVKDKSYEAPHTTPEALEFQAMLNEMVSAGCSHVVTEVSSHALAQRRVDYTNFDAAVFTNLTRDHLDFHVTMEDYYRAKERLFKELLVEDGTSVINFDDPYGRKLISELRDSKTWNLFTYGIEAGADLAAVNIKNSFDGLMFDVKFDGKTYSIQAPLIGAHNVYNILSAAGACVGLGVPWDAITTGIKNMVSVKGRFEKVNLGQNFLCIVDYAHTEDALERLICAARELLEGQRVHPSQRYGEWIKGSKGQRRIITVFGCGGDRDRGKRPRMCALATKLSDYVVITSDNPRGEDPTEIIKEVVRGALLANYVIEPERGSAIKKAIWDAKKGDIVLIAGKGHEDYQEIKGKRHHFSDREEAEKAIREKLNSGR